MEFVDPCSSSGDPFSSSDHCVLELTLEESNDNIDAPIHHLCHLSLQEEASKPDPPPSSVSQWAEMMKAISVNDDRSRTGKLLEALEKVAVEKEIG
ncbi:hypothetical protein LINPERHAP1_LOCUS11317 [Linum perenne]